MRASEELTKTIDQWHQFVKTPDPAVLDTMLHDDCVFLSPVVFSPQEGKALTSMYLAAAFSTFGGDAAANTASESEKASAVPGGFRYVKKVLDGHTAVLEFETTMDGKYVNGVDIITVDAEGLIVEFKVMIRPLQAVNKVHEQMKAILARMKEG